MSSVIMLSIGMTSVFMAIGSMSNVIMTILVSL